MREISLTDTWLVLSGNNCFKFEWEALRPRQKLTRWEPADSLWGQEVYSVGPASHITCKASGWWLPGTWALPQLPEEWGTYAHLGSLKEITDFQSEQNELQGDEHGTEPEMSILLGLTIEVAGKHIGQGQWPHTRGMGDISSCQLQAVDGHSLVPDSYLLAIRFHYGGGMNGDES